MKRREFLQSFVQPGLRAVSGAMLGSVLMPILPSQVEADTTNTSGRRVVLIELSGANDGLNTIIPYFDERYLKLRPTLGLSAQERIELDSQFAFHHAMNPLLDVWESGECAIVHGLGYPEPNRSHFSSIQLWESGGDGVRAGRQGWLTEALEQGVTSEILDAHGIAFDSRLGVFSSPQGIWLSMSSASQYAVEASSRDSDLVRYEHTPNEALKLVLSGQRTLDKARRSIAQKMRVRAPTFRLSGGPLAMQLGHAANLIAAGVNAPVYKVSLSGFDTHESQSWRHHQLLSQLSNALVQFRGVLSEVDEWDRTLVMTYSEFGRRAQENQSGGTDHGTAAPHLVMGGSVNGGFYGDHPSLGQLIDGDLQYSMDYRALYERVLRDWLNLPAGRFESFLDHRLNSLVKA